jgi:hypothetical protein
MKKSEMIEIIEDYLDSYVGQDADYARRHSKEDAETFLDSLEDHGMLPPLVFLDHFDRFDNVWESEDPVEAPNLASEDVCESDATQLLDHIAEKARNAFKEAVVNKYETYEEVTNMMDEIKKLEAENLILKCELDKAAEKANAFDLFSEMFVFDTGCVTHIQQVIIAFEEFTKAKMKLEVLEGKK